MTANMTAGPQGIQGIPGTNGLDNMTANMTAGPKGDKGDPGTVPDVSQFLFINGTRAMIGNLDLGNFGIINIKSIINPSDAVNLSYLQGHIINTSYLTSVDQTWNLSYPLLSGTRTITGKWNFGGYNISNVLNPVAAQDVATKNYVDTQGFIKTWDDSWNLTYPLLSGTRLYTGKMNLANNNVSNITTVAGGDAINLTLSTAMNTSLVSQVDAVNTSMRNNVTAINNTLVNLINSKTDMTWNGSDYLVDTSRPLTGNFIRRSVDNDLLEISGGTVSDSAMFYLSGKNYIYGPIWALYLPNATTTPIVGMYMLGGTDTPALNMQDHKIISLADPTLAQDAATKHYVDAVNTTPKHRPRNAGQPQLLLMVEQ